MSASEYSNQHDSQYVKRRIISQGSDPQILTNIYQELPNMVIWQRTLPATLTAGINDLLLSDKPVKIVTALTPKNALFELHHELKGFACAKALSENITLLVDMFCCLFELKRVGLRLTTLKDAMCPRFHVDRVPCRLVTTYAGTGTQWLPHSTVDRSKLGTGNQGLTDELSGLYPHPNSINQLACADVALMKGESWQGNENAGLVHRSPCHGVNDQRLLLTLDFLD
ncbi:MAG: DUF1826 domain-containing protein [Psychrobium sp.]|nr:DUF1826 domain-containing protein [Psychrobium sp.]